MVCLRIGISQIKIFYTPEFQFFSRDIISSDIGKIETPDGGYIDCFFFNGIPLDRPVPL